MKNIISLLMTFALSGVAQADVTAVLVSRDALGNPGNGSSTGASVSADGRLVAFVSDADNLVPGDTNTESDVFVKNTDTGGIVRVNENAGEMPGEGFRNSGEISANGRFIVFTSGVDDRASAGGGVSADVFVKNLETGVIVRVNEDADGAPLGEDGHSPSISADGRFVAFEVSEITSGFGGDVFVKDIETGELVRINEDAQRVRLGEFSSLPRISADGRIVVFENFDVRTIPTLTLYARNVATGEIVVVNQDVAGEQAIAPEIGHGISGDGRLVVLSTTARLVPGDTDDRRDGYVKNLDTGEVIRINEAADGSAGNGDIDSPYISSDGRFVVFRSAASNLVFGDTNDLADVFVKILATGEVVRIDIENANGAEEINALTASATGRFLSFDSSLAGLVPDDGNVRSDVFLLDTDETGPTPPGNLRVVVRSATEAEVLWDRSSDLGGIAGYEATRNGEFVGLLDTPGIVERDLQPGVRYTYSVTAVDDDGNRSATATVEFTTDGSAPSMPGNLRFEVYSDTAAELFWTRSTDDGRVRGYEIRINGEVATVRDGASYFTEALTKGVSYEFTVTAIDDEGHRSRPASVSFIGGNQGPGGAGDDSPPSAPSGLSASVYSATAGAVSWNRSTDDGGAVPGYEVTRDGVVLGTFDALGYVDFALLPSTLYSYGVTAIDNAGQRSSTSTVVLRTPDRHGAFGPVDNPVMPAELRATVWSRTAAGIAWRRAEAFGTRYVVSRDGEVLRDDTAFPLGTFGPTYSDFDLAPDRDHVYEIVSVDAQGRRSSPARLTVNTSEALVQRNGPPRPRGLLAEVWSRTAVGLTWERSPGFGTRYIVRRDSEIVRDGTLFDPGAFGPSYSDFDVVPGSHRYAVIAVDVQGRTSPFAEVFVDTLDDSGSSGGEAIDDVRVDNAIELVGATFDAFRGEPWADLLRAQPEFPRTPEPPFDEVSLDCGDGGKATIRPITGARRIGNGYVFRDCREDDAVFDGDLENFLEESHRVISAESLSVTRGGELLEFQGRVVDGREGVTRSLTVDEPTAIDYFEVISPTTFGELGRWFVERLRFQLGPDRAASAPTIELSGAIDFAIPGPGGISLYATTPEPLRRALGDPPLPDLDDPLFTEGSLRIESTEDGSFILLEADNGDEASARVTVDGAFGGRTHFDEPWRTWRERLLLD